MALKEIKESYADHPEHRARFLLEAEVTGCLEHPGVVPIYGLGRDLDGRPYYAMRFIEGESLRDSILRHRTASGEGADQGERTLRLRKLLSHFGDVCEAVAYAHSRGVIHRDLKPDNVMLGSYGETLIVDWGLAKAMGCCFLQDLPSADTATGQPRPVPRFETSLEATRVDPDSHPGAVSGEARAPGRPHRPLLLSSDDGGLETRVGSLLGTPAYMPPEQAQGDLSRVGPRSDIYSLGATLYCVLTGQPPFLDRDFGTLIGKVNRGDFPAPIQIDPSVPPALDAVVRKAMAFRPEDRYPTARPLGDDIDRWLADEPVSAYREPRTDRWRRWARRHRTVVTAASALLITAVAALSIGAVLLERERSRTDQERRVALRNYRLAYDAADTMLGEVAEVELVDIPQMEPVRHRLLETARVRFADLLGQRSDDPEVGLLAARTRVRLGDVLALMGRPAEAESGYREALAWLKALTPRLSGDDRLALEMAHACQGLGILLRRSNRFLEAETHLREAIGLLTRSGLANREDREVRKRLADCRYHLGALQARQAKRSPGQEQAYRQAIEDQETLLREVANEPDSIEKLSRYRNNLAILEARGKPAEAERQFVAILDSLERLDTPVRGLPGPRWQRGRASNNLGALLMRDPARAGEADH